MKLQEITCSDVRVEPEKKDTRGKESHFNTHRQDLEVSSGSLRSFYGPEENHWANADVKNVINSYDKWDYEACHNQIDMS